jgi:hypothetical protein
LKFLNSKDNPNLIHRKFNVEAYLGKTKQYREYNDPLVIFPEVNLFLLLFLFQVGEEK